MQVAGAGLEPAWLAYETSEKPTSRTRYIILNPFHSPADAQRYHFATVSLL